MSNLTERRPQNAQNETFENDEEESFISNDNLFFICISIVEILGLILVGLSIHWMLLIGGFGFEPKQIFNYHPPLMTFAMIFLNANGILIYRSTRTLRYKTQKTIHLLLQSAMIAISWLGLLAAFFAYPHSVKNKPHFYSLHSWLGLAGLIGVTFSLFSSFLTFLYPKASAIYRRLSLPFHVFGGIVNLALSAVVCVSGITEKAIFNLNRDPDPSKHYAALPMIAKELNIFGMILVVFTLLVIWMVTKSDFKRKYKMTVNTLNFVLRRQKTID